MITEHGSGEGLPRGTELLKHTSYNSQQGEDSKSAVPKLENVKGWLFEQNKVVRLLT